jgi:hypothetical protein
MISICLPFPQGRANWRRFKKNLRSFFRSRREGQTGEDLKKIFDLSSVPAGKGKLEKISVRISSGCHKGTREDLRQDIFEL